jgi:hypothetical protein
MPLSISSDGTVSGGSLGSSSSSSSSSNDFVDFYNDLSSRQGSGDGFYTSDDIAAAVESSGAGGVGSLSDITPITTAPTYGGYTTDQIQDAIQGIYGDVLGREADPLGLSTYTAKAQEQLASGVSAEDIIAGFTNEALGSQEYADRISSINEQVDAAYEDILGREGDTAGTDYWVDQLATGNISSVDFLDAFNNAAQAELDDQVEEIQVTDVSTKSPSDLFDTTQDKTYVNELGQTVTQADIDALGTRDDQGNYTIGNVANRVELDDGSTGYVVGTGNNRVDGGYNIGDTNYVAEGLLREAPTTEVAQIFPDAGLVEKPTYSLEDIQTDVDALVSKATFETDYTDPNDYTNFDEAFFAGKKTPTQILDDAIGSGVGITEDIFTDAGYTITDQDKFVDAYTKQNYGIGYDERIQSKYGTGVEGFNNFIGATEAAIDQGSSIFGNAPILKVANDGTILAEDPASFAGLMAGIAQGLSNFVFGQVGGGMIGNFVYGMTGGFEAPLYSAMIGRATIQGMQPVTAGAFVDENGEKYVVSSFFGKETIMTAEEAARLNKGGFESSMSDADIKNLQALKDASETPEWKQVYNDTANPLNAALNTVMGGILNGDTTLAGKALAAIKEYAVDGVDPITAVVRHFGDEVTKYLPEGYDTLTESAARIMVGENPIDVLGEKYGAEVGLEGPAGIAAIKGAVALDQGKSPQEALATSAYHYFKNGGELPSFEIPSFLEGSDVDINWPDVDLGFIEDGIKAAGEFVMGLFPEDFEGLDMSWLDEVGDTLSDWGDAIGSTVDDVYNWLKENMPKIDVDLPEIDVDLPDVDLPEIDVDLPDVDLPEIDVDLPDVDLPDVSLPEGPDVSLPEGPDLPEISLPSVDLELPSGGASSNYYASFDYVDPFKEKLGISEIDPVKYSQILLQNARKV